MKKPYGSRKQSKVDRAITAIAVLAVYGILIIISNYLAAPHFNYQLVNLYVGFAVAILLYYGYKYAIGIGFVSFLVGVPTAGLIGSAFQAVALPLFALASAYSINRYAGGTKAFDDLKNGMRFVGIISVVTVVSLASLIVIVLLLFPAASGLSSYYFPVLFSTWLGNLIGVLIVTPLTLLMLLTHPDMTGISHLPELIAVLLMTAFFTYMIFGDVPGSSLIFRSDAFLAVPIIWAAVLMSRLKTTAIIALITIISILGFIAGYGPYLPDTYGSGLGLQVFIFSVTIIGIFLSVTVFEKQTYARQLFEERNILDVRVKEEADRLFMSEKKSLHAKAAAEAKAHSELDKTKSVLMGMMGHELRSPITPIIGQLQMLSENYLGRLNKDQASAVGIALNNAHRLDKLTRDFIEANRAQTASIMLNYVRVNDLEKHISALVRDENNYLPEKGIRIVLHMHRLPVVKIDPDRIGEVLRNLIENAKKYSPEKSTITVRVVRRGRYIKFSVEDKGRGISEKNRKNIFKPFFQEVRNSVESHGGVGLGLAICKGIIESHGGKIWFRSVIGKGTAFFFTVPIRHVGDRGGR